MPGRATLTPASQEADAHLSPQRSHVGQVKADLMSLGHPGFAKLGRGSNSSRPYLRAKDAEVLVVMCVATLVLRASCDRP